MRRELKLKGLRSVLGSPTAEKDTPKGFEFVAFCPRHAARAGRQQGQLNVNVDTDQFHCWSCGWKGGNLLPLLRLGAPKNIIVEYAAELDSKRPKSHCTWIRVVSGSNYDEPKLPVEFKTLSLPDGSPYQRLATEYLKGPDRRLDDAAIIKMRLGYCEDGPYRFRIVVPSFDDRGDINFSVGRLYMGAGERYKHERLSKDVVFNDWTIDWTRPLDIVEGPFDYSTPLMAGINATCLLGSEMHHSLFKKIVDTGIDVYCALDGDAFDKQLDILLGFVEHGVLAHYVPVPIGHDPGKMTPAEYARRRSEAVPVREKSDLLRLRLRGPAVV